MRKLFLVLLAIFALVGVANAINIPQSEDAKNGPAIWTVPVYNNTTVLDVGDVVIWDIGNSTGDNDNYVTTTTTAGTYIIAGVVFPSAIAAGDTGTIAVRGVVQVDYIATGGLAAAGGILCTTTSAGNASNCTTDALMGSGGFGITTVVNSTTSVDAYINVQ